MKSIFSDPIDWATKAAGTRGRMIMMMSAHLIVPAVLIYDNLSEERLETFPLISRLDIPWVVLGTLLPCFYLYALYKVLSSRAR